MFYPSAGGTLVPPLGTALLLGLGYGVLLLRRRRRGSIEFLDLWRSHPLEQEAIRAMFDRSSLPPLIGWKENA